MPLRRAFLIAMMTLLCGSLAISFEISIHQQITEDSLNTDTGITAIIAGQPQHFSRRALDDIIKANAATDNLSSAALFFPSRHFTNDDFESASQRLKDLHDEIVNLVTASSPDGASARQRLGTAIHTVQDFYAHSLWVESGHTSGPAAGFGTVVLSDPPTSFKSCQDSDGNTLLSSPSLTSAYYIGILGCGPIPAGKCWHGNYMSWCIGVNKDLDAALAASHGVPMSPYHGIARSLAKLGTDAYVNSIISSLSGNDKALSALLDVRGDIGFVIDDTGSMSPQIGAVKTAVQNIVAINAADPALKPDNWVLERFNDPDYGPPLRTSSVSSLLSAVSALNAHGGGDCPELAFHGLKEAVETAAPNSTLFFFTDASAKDSGLANTVISLAQSKNIKGVFFVTGSCSPIDPAYIRMANETGGQFFFLSSTEVGIVQSLIQPLLSGNITRILSRSGSFASTNTALVDIPVDSTVTQLSVSVSIDAKSSISLLRPSGSPVAGGDLGVTITNLSSGAIITVKSPQVGAWKVNVTGSGTYSINADAVSAIELRNFSFVTANPDIHGGYFPIATQPQPGVPAIGDATLLGPFGSAVFSILDTNGNKLQDINLSQNYPAAVTTDFLGSISLPSVPFRLSVSGNDQSGNAYRRLFATVFTPQPVGVVVSGAGASFVPAGKTTKFSFVVSNVGTAATFNLLATDTRSFVSSISTSAVTLAQGASATVDVFVTVPGAAAGGTLDTVNLTATKSTDSTVFNSALLELTVSAAGIAGDLNGDGKVDCGDLEIVKLAFGKKTGQVGFDPRADVVPDGSIDIRDLAWVSQKLPAGTVCR